MTAAKGGTMPPEPAAEPPRGAAQQRGLTAQGEPASSGARHLAASDLPEVPAPPRRLSQRTRIGRLKESSPVFRWLWRHVWWLFLLFLGLYLLGSLAIGGWRPGAWKLALDIMVGGAPPSAVKGPGYFAAAALSLLGWLVVPAIVGSIASLIVGLLTVRRASAKDLDQAVERALGRQAQRKQP